MEIFIRAAKVDDYEFINGLSDQLGYKAGIEQTKERLSEILRSDDHCVFVATDSGFIIGWVHGFYTLRIESGPFAEIGGLVIAENYKRKGIGRILVEKVTEWSTHRNVSTIRVRCNTIRNESHQFYFSIGFEEIKEQKIFTRALK